MDSQRQGNGAPGHGQGSMVWIMRVGQEHAGPGQSSYYADVLRDGEVLCRLTMTGPYIDQEGAEQALAIRFRNWVEDYESRDHSGDTQFSASS
jgi:hypothetical protein